MTQATAAPPARYYKTGITYRLCYRCLVGGEMSECWFCGKDDALSDYYSSHAARLRNTGVPSLARMRPPYPDGGRPEWWG